ncbi:uncharacterized protein [Antedon mediterranea]|uniref:uncharacterized protein n=1 Tax=Antedon mediterranea TaxID=105859 RepID=UPI003AF4A903
MDNYQTWPLGKPVLILIKYGVHEILKYSNKGRDKLANCIEQLCNAYKGSSLKDGGGDVDFDDPAYQACYVFLYFPVLCYGISDSLQQCFDHGHLNTLLDIISRRGCLNVCALGGGPGTDLFGVKMFLNSNGYTEVMIRATVLDRHLNWKIAFNCLLSSLSGKSSVSVDYLHFEVGIRGYISHDHVKAIASADLITCSKFISAIKALPNSQQTLRRLLNQAKPGAFILYLENSKGGNTDFFSSVARQAQFIEVYSIDRDEEHSYRLPKTEKSWYINDMSQHFNFRSQRNLRVKCMLWRKTGQIPAVSPSSEGRHFSYTSPIYPALYYSRNLLGAKQIIPPNQTQNIPQKTNVVTSPTLSHPPRDWRNSIHTGYIYFDNLDKAIDNKALNDIFSEFGNMLSCKIQCDENNESNSYGFIQFEKEEAASKAIRKVNGMLHNGKEVYLGWIPRKTTHHVTTSTGNSKDIMGSKRNSSLPGMMRDVFIANLDKAIDNKALYDAFSVFGKILSCKILCDENNESKGYGFIQFKSEDAASKAISKVNGMLHNGKQVYLSHMIRRKARAAEKVDKMKSYINVYVKNLNLDITDDQLVEKFSKYGKIVSAKVMRDENSKSRGFGFVSFENHDAASKAIQDMKNIDTKCYIVRAQKQPKIKLND